MVIEKGTSIAASKTPRLYQPRLGRKPVPISDGVKVSLNVGQIVVEGKRGKLTWALPHGILAEINGKEVLVKQEHPGPETKSLHAVSRRLILNMIEGVMQGFQKRLIIEGVGFRAQVTGDKLTMQLGFSHPAVFTIPKDVKVSSDPKIQNMLIIEGNDKQRVGQIAAEIRAMREPEPYKGTGIRYEHEFIKRKAGKAAVTAAGGAKK